MKLVAPCGHEVSLGDTLCPECQASVSAPSIILHYCGSLVASLSKPVHFSCPYCQKPVPMSAVECPNCGKDVTPNAVIDREIQTQKERFEQVTKQTSPRTRRRIQLLYLLLSVGALWLLLAANEEYFSKNWLEHWLLSIIYLGTIFLIYAWLRPKRKKGAPPLSNLTKLSLTLNYLALVFLLQMWIATWWTRALSLAGAIAVTWVGAWLFNKLQPGFQRFLQRVFAEDMTTQRTFNSTERQGRTARYE